MRAAVSWGSKRVACQPPAKADAQPLAAGRAVFPRLPRCTARRLARTRAERSDRDASADHSARRENSAIRRCRHGKFGFTLVVSWHAYANDRSPSSRQVRTASRQSRPVAGTGWGVEPRQLSTRRKWLFWGTRRAGCGLVLLNMRTRRTSNEQWRTECQ